MGALDEESILGTIKAWSLTSNFDLQMSGKLPNDIEILAAISDNNIPIQADGNTHNSKILTEFSSNSKNNNTPYSWEITKSFAPKATSSTSTRKVQGAKFSTSKKLGNANSKVLSMAQYPKETTTVWSLTESKGIRTLPTTRRKW